MSGLAGFIYIGTAKEKPEERPAPDARRDRFGLEAVIRLGGEGGSMLKRSSTGLP